MKLISKSRVGARVKKEYDQAQTPWERLQNANLLRDDAKERYCKRYLALNPAKLRRDIEEMEMGLRQFSVGEPNPPVTANTCNVTIEIGENHAPVA